MSNMSYTDFVDSVDACIVAIDNYKTGFRCVWTISDYAKIYNETEFPNSVTMKYVLNLSLEKSCICSVVLYPHGWNIGEEPEVCFEYVKHDSEMEDMSATLKLSLLDPYQEPFLSKECTGEDTVDDPAGCRRYINLNELCDPEDFLDNGSLVILLEGGISTKMNVCNDQIEVCELPEERLNILDIALKQLNFQSKYSDVCFCVGEEQFELHKVFLVGKSEIFEEMFSDQEEDENIIELEDLTADVIRELIHFIYTNSVTQKFHDMALDLLRVADIYEVFQLKKICENYLISKLVAGNAAKYFFAAYKYSAYTLMNRSAQLIRENWIAVQRTAEWRELRNNPYMMAYLMDVGNFLEE